MPPNNILFDIFEITTLIANQLSQHDLAACCLVSHFWFNIFTPHLSYSITILPHDPSPKFTTAEGLAGLLRNGHHIRVIPRQGSTPMRSSAMIAVGRRGSTGVGQRQVSPYAVIGTPAPLPAAAPVMTTLESTSIPTTTTTTTTTQGSTSTSSETVQAASLSTLIGDGSAATGLFGAPATTGLFDALSPSATGSASPATSAFSAAPAPAPSLFGTASAPTSLFGGASKSVVLEPASTGFGHTLTTASSSSIGSIPTPTFGRTPVQMFQPSLVFSGPLNEPEERILISILQRNPRLEFLVVPSHCLKSHAVVKVVAESLPELKEFYSPMDLWSRGGSTTSFVLTKGSKLPTFGNLTPVSTGNIQSPMSYSIFAIYPRLRDLQQGVIARINQEALERIRSTDKDSFDHVRFDGWDLSHISLVLKELPTTIAISFDLHELDDEYLDATNIPVFFKCASTLGTCTSKV
ncbi:MAG: hypothetical protein J3R72DRAFT_520968 [Linnemannia gamsii]|nr:MAG: hypothetical protein J3R72DRAFT_520968 [Linnemannia gamsii]